MKDLTTTYEPVIGLEIHAQLLTQSKIFCGCSTKFGSPQNTQTCPVCMGLPGVLPVPNRVAFDYAIKMGLAANCTISPASSFARKNYFYPDLPKGYQITQYEEPLCRDGFIILNFENESRKIRINRIHLEEDAGKSIHAEAAGISEETAVDLNRCGVPLIEIVTEPDIRAPGEASVFLQNLRRMLLYLEICDGTMEEASLRCDANISIRPAGSKFFGAKTELKNLNSFHAVEKALEYEFRRQAVTLQQGKKVKHATLLWDEKANRTVVMRSKEEASEYRYFPEPDLVPVIIENKWVERIKSEMPELPDEKRLRFVTRYSLPEYDASLLTESRKLADYFEQVSSRVGDAKLTSNWILTEVLRTFKFDQNDIRGTVSSEDLAELLLLVKNNTITRNSAKEIFSTMLETGRNPQTIVEEMNLAQISNQKTIDNAIDTVLSKNPREVARYQNGEQKLFGYFFGQIMIVTKGRANPQQIQKRLHEKLTRH